MLAPAPHSLAMTRIAISLAAALLTLLPGTASSTTSGDRERAQFEPCGASPRITCIVDGDTFWYGGTKIRMADINTPETAQAACAQEAALGLRAKQRLGQLLNAGPFTLEVRGRETDRYGRALRVVTRKGESLGARLEAEGLAEHWKGRRGNWCGASGGA
ncbi:hypothetical protein NVSP9465_02927 [Novosphingobium sp. CECT 9465]|nr:hypothetical protein NVSP9465_02927 [Novosphingobium sp. CECT 9465]